MGEAAERPAVDAAPVSQPASSARSEVRSVLSDTEFVLAEMVCRLLLSGVARGEVMERVRESWPSADNSRSARQRQDAVVAAGEALTRDSFHLVAATTDLEGLELLRAESYLSRKEVLVRQQEQARHGHRLAMASQSTRTLRDASILWGNVTLTQASMDNFTGVSEMGRAKASAAGYNVLDHVAGVLADAVEDGMRRVQPREVDSTPVAPAGMTDLVGQVRAAADEDE